MENALQPISLEGDSADFVEWRWLDLRGGLLAASIVQRLLAVLEEREACGHWLHIEVRIEREKRRDQGPEKKR